jgi:hypothetical protein
MARAFEIAFGFSLIGGEVTAQSTGMKVLYQTGDMDEPEPATVVEVIGDWYYRVLTDEGYEYELDGTAITTVLGSRRAQ